MGSDVMMAWSRGPEARIIMRILFSHRRSLLACRQPSREPGPAAWSPIRKGERLQFFFENVMSCQYPGETCFWLTSMWLPPADLGRAVFIQYTDPLDRIWHQHIFFFPPHFPGMTPQEKMTFLLLHRYERALAFFPSCHADKKKGGEGPEDLSQLWLHQSHNRKSGICPPVPFNQNSAKVDIVAFTQRCCDICHWLSLSTQGSGWSPWYHVDVFNTEQRQWEKFKKAYSYRDPVKSMQRFMHQSHYRNKTIMLSMHMLKLYRLALAGLWHSLWGGALPGRLWPHILCQCWGRIMFPNTPSPTKQNNNSNRKMNRANRNCKSNIYLFSPLTQNPAKWNITAPWPTIGIISPFKHFRTLCMFLCCYYLESTIHIDEHRYNTCVNVPKLPVNREGKSWHLQAVEMYF